jgi:hypothetical protein
MAIERSVEILIMCDHYDEHGRCLTTRDSEFDTITEATFWLRDEGWTIGKKVLCPEHRKTGRP